MELVDNIVKIAKSYVGQEEIKDNQGFKDQAFWVKMNSVGFYKGAPWCAFLAKLVWTEAFKLSDPNDLALVRRYSSGSALETYHNYKNSKEFHVSTTPTLGSVVIWQEGNGTAGHAGIVIAIPDSSSFISVEGNSNSDGSREGYITVTHTHKLNQPHSDHGLNLLGFINPIKIS